jgi:FkbM family methyltransferase
VSLGGTLARLVALARGDVRHNLTVAAQVFAFERVLKLPLLFTDENGLKLVLYPGQNAQIYLQHRGNYEVAESRFCSRHLAPGMTVVDVGANIGFYALRFAQLVGPSGAVHAFEPEAVNFERLRTNIALNGFTQVHAVQAALFASSGPLALNVFPDAVHAWHTLGAPALPVAPRGQQSVRGVTLDEYCAQQGIAHIDLLKVDVEGAELEVFRGAQGLLARGAIGAILFEISLPQLAGMGHRPEEVVAALVEHGFELHGLDDNGGATQPLPATWQRYQNVVALGPATRGRVVGA